MIRFTPMIPLQPYRKFDVSVIQELIAEGNIYLVSQGYNRAKGETETHQTPILFTAYRNFYDALIHYNTLEEKADQCAAIIDLSKSSGVADLTERCNEGRDEVSFFSQVKDSADVNQHLQKNYEMRLQTWINKEKERWQVDAVHVPQYELVTLIGEPVVRIKYGEYFAIASLDELYHL